MPQPELIVTDFGHHRSRAVRRYTFTFPGKLVVSILNYGGIIQEIQTPDRKGRLQNVVLGYSGLEQYQHDTAYLGALIGRYANRIEKGLFSLKGKTYQLTTNSSPHHLHGGQQGFNQQLWEVLEARIGQHQGELSLSYTSPAGEEGYPGQLSTVVTYTISANTLEVNYRAQTTESTPVALTQHTYFNLSGNYRQDILHHSLKLRASKYLPLNKNQIPSGTQKPVAYSPFDFRQAKPIMQDINRVDEQLERGRGYDHYYILDQSPPEDPVAELYEDESGRLLELFTTEPGLQLYSGNFLPQQEGPVRYRTGICLETHGYPNAPNEPRFPSSILEPGDTYQSQTTFRFGLR